LNGYTYPYERDRRGWIGPRRPAQEVLAAHLAQLKTSVPNPLAQDLPELLALCSAGAPAINILRVVLVTEHLLKAAPLVVQGQHLGRSHAGCGVRDQEEFVDMVPDQLAHGNLLRGFRGRAAGDDHATGQRQLRQRL